jgi:ferredoxin
LNETIPSNFDSFPADRNTRTCAAMAISLGVSGTPVIDHERCIMCGVCASRCPVGAIHLEPGIGAVIEDNPNAAFVEEKSVKEACNKALLKNFSALSSEGTILEENDDILDYVFEQSTRAWNLVGERYPNMLARNLLIGAGLGASVGRKGNNYMRMDLLLSPPGVERGVAEVEFGQEAVLDAPRDIMDALAVLISRYGWTVDTSTALIVTDILPNKRSEYWHIIQDIDKVLRIHIGTVTLFALMLIIWNHKKLDLRKGHPFYIDRSNDSYCVFR